MRPVRHMRPCLHSLRNREGMVILGGKTPKNSKAQSCGRTFEHRAGLQVFRLEHSHPSNTLFSGGSGHKMLQAGDFFVLAPFVKSCIQWHVFLKDTQRPVNSCHSHLFLSKANQPGPIPMLIDPRPLDALSRMVIFSCVFTSIRQQTYSGQSKWETNMYCNAFLICSPWGHCSSQCFMLNHMESPLLEGPKMVLNGLPPTNWYCAILTWGGLPSVR